jgi:multiple sugar transport system permease protein
MGYFKSVPRELEDAARIDGASRLQTMFLVFLPLCKPGFISAGIFAFTLAQNEFLYALIFLTDTSVRTVPVGAIAELIRGDVFYWGQLMRQRCSARSRLRSSIRSSSSTMWPV